MDFVVTLKGFRCFLGKFSGACAFIRAHRGSQTAEHQLAEAIN
ncbi:MAG: hypothetical protein NTY41_08750 [Proteobacteria bacterium]|nr:hypothetical protein [Pseudomonadota bacterium]